MRKQKIPETTQTLSSPSRNRPVPQNFDELFPEFSAFLEQEFQNP